VYRYQYWSGSVLVWSLIGMEFVVFLFLFRNFATFMLGIVLKLLAEVKN